MTLDGCHTGGWRPAACRVFFVEGSNRAGGQEDTQHSRSSKVDGKLEWIHAGSIFVPDDKKRSSFHK
jgi:hypothetical protein